MIPHWRFPFPNLQSCHVNLQIDDSPITALMTSRLLMNCPALHTLDLRLMAQHEHTIIFTQQREMIRRMREPYHCFKVSCCNNTNNNEIIKAF